MARATQGLQIALIVSVMLNVVLGVTTYLYNKQAFENLGKATAATKGQADEKLKTQATEEKFDRARKVVGLPDADIDQIEKRLYERQVEVGLATKAAGDADQKPAGGPGYDQIVERVCATRDERTKQLKDTQQVLTNLQTSYRNLEAAGKSAYDEFTKGAAAEKQRNEENNSKAEKQISDMATTEANVVTTEKNAGALLNASLIQARAQLTAARKALVDKEEEIKPWIKKARDVEREIPEPPSGEITYVSLPTKTVWIDKGRADYLPERLRFTVYAAESNTAAKAVEKGTVEVTRVLDDHRAECRIVDDKFGDPITPGDKVFTAFWAPGQPKHFAFSGSMNLDGDGRNQVKAAIALVKQYGGVVDCWLDEQGRKVGAITVATSYIIRGDAPNTASQDAVKANVEIERDATNYQLKPWSLADFKQKLNYQKTSSLESFGSGASSGDTGPAAAPAPATTRPTTPKAKAAAASKADDEFKP